MKQIFFFRHGMTEANRKKLYCGTSDLPLREEGRQALLRLKREFPEYYRPAEGCFSTPCLRTAETMKLLLGETNPIWIPEFMECAFGEYELHSYEELKSRPDYIAWILDESGTVSPPGGESRMEFAGRLKTGLERLLAREESTLAVACHGGGIANLMSMLFPEETVPGEDGTPRKKAFYDWQPGFGRGYLVTFSHGKPAGFQMR